MNSRRAKHPYGIRYKFTGSIADVEEWLYSHCKGGFSYDLADVLETDTPFGQLDVMFHFETSEDRELFKLTAKTRPAW